VLVPLASAASLGAADALRFCLIALDPTNSDNKSFNAFCKPGFSKTWSLPAGLASSLDAQLVLPLELAHLVFVHGDFVLIREFSLSGTMYVEVIATRLIRADGTGEVQRQTAL
jgi:hypothetical protein